MCAGIALGHSDEYPQYSHLNRGDALAAGSPMGEMGPSGVEGSVIIEALLRAESWDANNRLGMMPILVTDGGGGEVDSLAPVGGLADSELEM